MADGISGVGLTVAAAGAVFVYGGITGKSPLVALYSVVRGDSPASATQTLPIQVNASTPTTPGGDHVSAGFVGGGSTGGDTTNANLIVSVLSPHISNKNAIAGILGNVQIESSFNPQAYNADEGAIGFCQWELGRRTNLQKFAASHGSTETDPNIQSQFIWHELTGSESAALIPLLAATSPELAAAIVDSMYERSSGSARQEREAAARAWYTKLYGG